MLGTKCVGDQFQMQCKIYNHAEMFDLKELLQTTEDFLILSADDSNLVPVVQQNHEFMNHSCDCY